MKRLIMLAAGLCLLGAGSTHAAHPGFVDLGSLDERAGVSPGFAMTLNDWMLQFGRDALEESPELAALRGLEAVSVRIYRSASASVREAGESLTAELVAGGWMPVVQVNDEADRVRVMMMPDGDGIAGLTVLVQSAGGEAVFVNAYGAIRSEDLAGLLSGMGSLDALDGVDLAVGTR